MRERARVRWKDNQKQKILWLGPLDNFDHFSDPPGSWIRLEERDRWPTGVQEPSCDQSKLSGNQCDQNQPRDVHGARVAGQRRRRTIATHGACASESAFSIIPTPPLHSLTCETDSWIKRETIFCTRPCGGCRRFVSSCLTYSSSLHCRWCATALQLDTVAPKAPSAAARRFPDERKLFTHRSTLCVTSWS